MKRTDQDSSKRPVHIVGIGASAGGLNALESFFDQAPVNSDLAFVVIQHLSPHFKSLMDDLLARHTTMPIRVATEGVEVEANTIYLIPPNTQMSIRGNQLRLSQRNQGQSPELPIDFFLNSLAESARSSAIAIILSGTGTDGSRGVKSVHQAGGLVLVQTPETAQFDGMPRSALASGVCHATMAPEDMPALLVEYAKDPWGVRERLSRTPGTEPRELEFSDIFDRLRDAFEVDFSKYKATTVARRVQRRMDFLQVNKIGDYAAILGADREELNALYHDLLIGVTEFFRDPKSFDFLAEHVLPTLIREIRPEEDLRIWSAGCATGEEAYSLAILANEAAEAAGFSGRVSVFATDVHRTSLEMASAGQYERQRLLNVAPARLARYFRQESDNQFRVTSELRKMVIFAPHNLTNDAPFTKLDLVCCRNLLIYLQPELQDRAISLFHFALRMNGVMFLGSSEGLGNHANLFEAIDGGHRVFRKTVEHRVPLDLPTAGYRPPRIVIPAASPTGRGTAIDRQLLHDYDTILGRLRPGVIVNENREVLHYFGDIARFFAAPEGRPRNDLLEMARDELQVALSTALPRAARSRESVVIRNVRIHRDTGEFFVNLSVEPIWDPKSRTSHYHVSFTELRPTMDLEDATATPLDAQDFDSVSHYRQMTVDLKQELNSTKENLQTAIEELQTSNEQLQATNEELLASNEELQSTNEELHSVNEELYTVNTEFERKNNELRQLNLDHEHLLASMETGIIFLDRNLRIRKFNPAIGNSFRLLPQDIGRPIDHIAYHLNDRRQVLEDVQEVLRTGAIVEDEASTPEGAVLLKRVLPFRSENGTIQGVLLTFTDVTTLKQAERAVSRTNAELEQLVQQRTGELRDEIQARMRTEDALKESLEKYRVLFNTLQPLAFMITDAKGKIREANQYSHELLGIAVEDPMERTIYSEEWAMISGNGELLGPKEFPPVKALEEGRTITNNEVGIVRPGYEVRWLSVSAAPIPLDDYGVAITLLDITERKAAVDALRASEKRFRTLFETMQEGFALHQLVRNETGAVVDYRFVEVNSAFARLFSVDRETILGRTMRQVRPSVDPLWLDRFTSVAETGEATQFEEYVEELGRFFEVTVFCPMKGYFATVFLDATDRRRYQEEQLKRQKLESLGVLAGGIAHDFNNIFTAVIGNLSLAMSIEQPSAQSQHLLKATLEACERAAALSRQLLTFAHGGEPVKAVLQPVRILEETAEMATRGSNIRCDWKLQRGIYPIEADAGQMTQVFNNILINAVQAMPGGGTLRIEVENVQLEDGNDVGLAAGNYVKMTFSDEGYGIAPENLDKIFDPYFTTKSRGTGLGLASVHSIVTRHGGHVAATSVARRGATFTLHLPATSKPVAAGPAAENRAPERVGGGARILVMDDQEPIRQLVSDIVTFLGYAVVTAEDGAEAITRYQEALETGERYSAVILDLTVPGGMGGTKAAAEILKIDPEARLIVSSGYSTDPILSNFAGYGFCAGVGKPYTATQLAKVLNQVVHATAGAGEGLARAQNA